MYVAGLWSRSQPFFIFGQSRIVYSALVLAMRLKITEKKSLRKAIFNVQLVFGGWICMELNVRLRAFRLPEPATHGSATLLHWRNVVEKACSRILDSTTQSWLRQVLGRIGKVLNDLRQVLSWLKQLLSWLRQYRADPNKYWAGSDSYWADSDSIELTRTSIVWTWKGIELTQTGIERAQKGIELTHTGIELN